MTSPSSDETAFDFEAERDRVLDAALTHVPFDGWTEAALARGATDCGHEPAMALRLFPRGAIETIELFSVRADRRMMEELEQRDLSTLKVRERIALGVRLPCQTLLRLPEHNAAGHQQHDAQKRRGDQCPLVPSGELAEAIPCRRRAREHRLIRQIALHIHREAVGRLVTSVAVLLQRLHHDPVQLAAYLPAQIARLALAIARRRRCRIARLRLRDSARAGQVPRQGSAPPDLKLLPYTYTAERYTYPYTYTEAIRVRVRVRVRVRPGVSPRMIRRSRWRHEQASAMATRRESVGRGAPCDHGSRIGRRASISATARS